VKSGQVDQRDTMLGGERRKHQIEGGAVGEQRVQQHQIGAGAGAHRGQGAVTGR